MRSRSTAVFILVWTHTVGQDESEYSAQKGALPSPPPGGLCICVAATLVATVPSLPKGRLCFCVAATLVAAVTSLPKGRLCFCVAATLVAAYPADEGWLGYEEKRF